MNYEKSILFIADDDGLLVKTMIKNLKEDGFNVISKNPSVDSLSSLMAFPKIIITYFSDNINAFKPVFQYLSGKVSNHSSEYVIFICGDENEIAVANDLVPSEILTEQFVRPVNIQTLVATINNKYNSETFGVVKYKKRILVVDDDNIFLRTMDNFLRKDYDVYLVSSGIDAVSFLAKYSVDLVLLDYEMPGIDGVSLLKMLKAEPNTALIPVMFLTSKNDKDLVKNALEIKPEGYILKSIPLNNILAYIKDFFKEIY